MKPVAGLSLILVLALLINLAGALVSAAHPDHAWRRSLIGRVHSQQRVQKSDAHFVPGALLTDSVINHIVGCLSGDPSVFMGHLYVTLTFITPPIKRGRERGPAT
jgi:hypothetical protein